MLAWFATGIYVWPDLCVARFVCSHKKESDSVNLKIYGFLKSVFYRVADVNPHQEHLMNLYRVAAAITATFFVVNVQAQTGVNQFSNPNFDDGLWGWNINVVNSHEDDIRWVEQGGDGMNSSARFYSDICVNPAWHMQLAQKKLVDAGDTISVSFDVATTSQYARNVTLYIQQDGGAWTLYKQSACSAPGVGIARCSLTGVAPKSEYVNIGIKGADNLWDFTVDNAMLTIEETTPIYLSDIHFPDPVLAQCISDTGLTMVSELTRLECGGEVGGAQVTDATGLQYLTSMEILDLTFNALNTIDVSRMTNLIYLFVQGNHLTSLNLSNNTNLRTIEANENAITAIDVPPSTSLSALILDNNLLSEVDLSMLPELTFLSLWNNNLSQIDIRANKKLDLIALDNNHLQSIDLSENTLLRQVLLGKNPITSLDVTHNPVLENIGLSFSAITSMTIPENSALAEVYFYFTPISCETVQTLRAQHPLIDFKLERECNN
jgi:hypothetical protein